MYSAIERLYFSCNVSTPQTVNWRPVTDFLPFRHLHAHIIIVGAASSLAFQVFDMTHQGADHRRPSVDLRLDRTVSSLVFLDLLAGSREFV